MGIENRSEAVENNNSSPELTEAMADKSLNWLNRRVEGLIGKNGESAEDQDTTPTAEGLLSDIDNPPKPNQPLLAVADKVGNLKGVLADTEKQIAEGGFGSVESTTALA